MEHTLPPLPYKMDALAPHLSAETLEYHWGKHHRGYIETLNRLIRGTSLAGVDLDSLVRRSSGAVFNNAAQHFNHSLYWTSMSPDGGGEPAGALGEALARRYGSFARFRSAFVEMAGSHFGSGWAWLVRKPDGSAEIELTHDAGCPLTRGDTPLLACDLWEHAYYIDYRNKRASYLEAFWRVAAWGPAEARFEDSVVKAVPRRALESPVHQPARRRSPRADRSP